MDTLSSDWDHPQHTGNTVYRPHVSASEQHETVDNGEDVSAFAEAYPEEPAANEVNIGQRQEEQKNEVLPQNDSIPVVEDPAPEDALPVSGENAQADPAVPVVPLAPLTPSLAPTKPSKVHVELDASAVAENDENDEDELLPFLPPKKNNGKNNGGAQAPPYSFFPNIFSDASGATIAVANAFSNGKGAARSHAIAYGSRGSPKRGSNKKRFADVE